MFNFEWRHEIRDAYLSDAKALGGRLREDDLDELDAYDPLLTMPEDAIERAIGLSKVARTLVLSGLPEAVWGVVDEGEGVGRIWMLAAARVTEDRSWFLRESRDQLNDLATGFVEVYNLVDERYDRALRWLDWLGFRPVGRCQAMMSGLPLTVMSWRVPDGTGSPGAADDHHGHGCRRDGLLGAEEA